ncbi:Cell division protein FtsY [Rickettsiales bacterium Ac37b]|nr:Cell division protein FtsY [Rickettsiales bacterium Ac37b]
MTEKEQNFSWFNRLKLGLSKSSNKISQGISNIFTKKKLDRVSLEELEELLIEADLGVTTSAFIIKELSRKYFDKEVTGEEIKQELASIIENMLKDYAVPISLNEQHIPQIMLVCGVNGNGKTTTIGKLSAYYQKLGKKVLVAACDTFRAAAVSQLKVWAEKVACKIVYGQENSDPASVAYQAVEQALAEKIDIVLIDTAGRLHNKANLMEELAKMIRVIKKLSAAAPHNIVLVLDATTGQNADRQVEVFQNQVKVSGLIITKLDGTAKAGVVVNIAKKYSLPIHAIGVGEGILDLQPFDPKMFAEHLVGISDYKTLT